MPSPVDRSAQEPFRHQAEMALGLVDSDPRAAVGLAASVLDHLKAAHGGDAMIAAVVAHRALGLALREIGDADLARKHLRAAIRIADRRGDSGLATECRISLAFLESEAGRTSRALALLDACDTAPGSVDRARVVTTRALALQRVGQHAAALRQYDGALAHAEQAGDHIQLGRILNNRAMSRAYLGHTGAARLDLQQAAGHYRAAGATALAAQAIANEAWVLGMAGDVPASLRCFDRAQAIDPHSQQPEQWTDRAEVYLRAGLHADAVRSAQRAVDWLSGRGWEAPEAEAALLVARCRLALGDRQPAAEWASRAAALFTRQGRHGWVPLASYVRTQAEISNGSLRPSVVTRVSRQLWEAGWRQAAVDVVVTAAVMAMTTGRPEAARTLLARSDVLHGRANTADLRSRMIFADALRHELAGDHAAGQRLLRRSFRLIERRRALLGAADMRALSSALATDVVDSGVRIAIAQQDARELFAWAERGRAAGFRYRPALPAADDQLQDALTRLRWATRAVEESRLEGMPDRAAAAEATRWEGEVMRHARRASGAAPVTSMRLAEVRRLLGTGAFVHLLIHRERVVSVVLTSRTVEIQDHGTTAALGRITARVQAGSRRAALGGPHDEAALALLGELLWEPIAARCSGRRIVLSAPEALADVPWGAVPGVSAQVLTVVPSAQAWVAASARSRRDRVVMGVAGPGLPAAEEEAAAVVAAYGRGRILAGSDATAAALLAACSDSDVLHVAAHGRLRTDNPLFSSLELHDGPVTAYDLERLGSLPSTVVLSCCHAGAGQAVAPGESLGLASTLLRLGARTVVAPVGAVDDRASAPVMGLLHRLLESGLDPGTALAALREEQDPTARMFVAYGA